MGGLDFDMLDVLGVWIDAGLPGNNRVTARIECHHGCRESNAITHFNFRGDGVEINAAAVKPSGNDGILGTADYRGTQGNHLADQVGALSCQLAREVTAKAPADQIYFLLFATSRKGENPFQYFRQQIGYGAAVSPKSPTVRSIAQ